ncbi:aminoacyl-tRNA hydrolase [Proteinivorax hydrogeniformans]|uniref:Peptidyl-tRNA hydrolase n=1 Tax=Proteinivorax hydrogeniformans TaxID=1826727 RepID=A0AAU8HTN7_9FIRM
MKVVVGLGNPEPKYQLNRHNVGFMAVDNLADKMGLQFTKERKFHSLCAQTNLKGEKIMLVKPLTYMNLSGESVSKIANYFNLNFEDVIVIYDDLDTEVGKFKIKAKGGSGGQKGLQSIIDHLGCKEIPRIKVGIGKPQNGKDVTAHVLGNFTKEECEEISQVLVQVKKSLEDFCNGIGIEQLMSTYNKK